MPMRDYMLIGAGIALGISVIDFIEGYIVLPGLLLGFGVIMIAAVAIGTPHKNANTTS
jgi:hypothetical protein